ncbi:MAG: hypothetical protein Q8Q32_00575, partial [bacterium]|nr:hypothetical protein [bacterium]
CTMEAKLCPDGSAVGRTGPNCEFAQCPGQGGGSQYPGNGNSGGSSSNVSDYFANQMNAKAVAQVGQPIEGFTPDMFMQAFPGLVASDFQGVEAALGVYQVQNGQINFIYTANTPPHSAERAITEQGMQTLLANVSSRLGISTTSQAQIDKIIRALEGNQQAGFTYCQPSQRNADACIEIYQPVCGQVQVECVTTPCNPVPETFSNSCFACMNERVIGYTQGAC